MIIIQNNFLFFLLFLSSIYSYSQDEIKGKVMDRESGAALENVHILSLKDSTVVLSNKFGEFNLEKLNDYKFSRIGYNDEIVKNMKSKYVIIQLTVKSTELNEVLVSTNQIPIKLKKSVATIHIISLREIERENDINIVPILNKVPGIYMHTGALNTNRITIRGIGSRNLFGTAKIRAYFEDIPLTSGNGETTIEDFELNTIARLEIIKGAASSIYGAGLGGVIHLVPKKTVFDKTYIDSELSIGSFGLAKGNLSVNHGGSKNGLRAIYSNTHSDGYRANNEYDRQTFTLTSNHYFNEKNEISFVGSYVDLKAFIPSSLNKDAFNDSPTSAAFTWAKSKGFEDAQRGVFGLSWKHQYKENVKQITSIFTSFREAYEARPFNVLTENTLALGLRSRLLGNTNLFKNKLDWTLGGEFFRDYHSSKTFKNLYKDFPTGTGSVQGNSLSNFKENRNYYNLFFETNYHFDENTMLSVGLNFNKTIYILEDRFITSENPDQSGDYDFKGVFSPKVGLSHLVTEHISLYTSVGHGFSPPSLSETLLPDGQINTEIQPESGWNFELGTRGSLYDNKLQFNLAIFRLAVRNLLVARRVADDQYIGVNAGKTQHDGLELTLNYHLINSEIISVNSHLSYTLNNFIFNNFIDEGQDFSDNDLTGVPSEIFNAGLDFSSNLGIYGNINFQHVGSMPITDSNSLFSDAYNLATIKIGYKFQLLKKLSLNTFLGIDNVFDEVYASQILINASSFGGKAPRYYYPGNPLNYYTGIHLKYVF